MTRSYVRHSLTSNELGVLEALEVRGGTLEISVPRFASLVVCSGSSLRGRWEGWSAGGLSTGAKTCGMTVTAWSRPTR